MTVSMYSVVMSWVWFTITLLAGSYLIIHGRKIRRELIWLVFILGFIRLVVPVETKLTHALADWTLYPFLRGVAQWEVISGISLATLILWIVLIGCIVELTGFGYRLWQLGRIVRKAGKLSDTDSLYRICRRSAERLGYEGDFTVAITKEFSTAVSAGALSPVILIPEEILTFPKKEFEGIFMHELMHFLRRDVGKKWSLNLLQCLFWWNPVIYYVKKGAEQLIELHCDAAVCSVMSEEEKVAYLQGIMNVVKITPRREVECGVGYAKDRSGRFLQRRFQEVLEPVQKQSKVVTWLLAGVCIGLFVGSYLVIIQPATAPDVSEIEGIHGTLSEEEVRDFLIDLSDGTYLYMQDMIERGILTEEEIKQFPYNELPVYGLEKGE